MEKFNLIFIQIDKILTNILKYMTIVFFLILTLILSVNVFLRHVPLFSMHWFDEIVEMLFSALVFYGAAALWISKGHFSAGDWISKLIASKRIKYLYRTILELIVLVFAGLFLYYTFYLFMNANDVTNALAIPKRILYSCMPVSGLIMFLYSIKNVLQNVAGIIKPKEDKDLPLNETKTE